MPGIEHAQMDLIVALFQGSAAAGFNHDLMDPDHKTPNQRALACAIALSWARQSNGQPPPMTKATAVAQTNSLFADMASFGHQTVGLPHGCEEGAPDPHSELWLGAMATILRESLLQNIPDLSNSAIGYFADHVAMIRPFWTELGERIPCARAKPVPGQPLLPNWTVDSIAFANILGKPTAGLPHAVSRALPILLACNSGFPGTFDAIATASNSTTLKLAVPIRLWTNGDGSFTAAFAAEQFASVQLFEPCAWLSVDPSGTIRQAAKDLSDFTPPNGNPVIVGDSTPVADPVPIHGPGTVPTPAGLPALAAQVRSLLLPHKQAALKEEAAEDIENGKLAAALPLVQSFGIGDNQPQAVTWKSIIATLQGALG
ncbi:MAG TPA: hypothetical protein VH988_04365 [Thermoanaerobaculia bacterium]|jgi:hypothetical protein|nr:hypothetical protein [Thermoanaerobaculia bacterium]